MATEPSVGDSDDVLLACLLKLFTHYIMSKAPKYGVPMVSVFGAVILAWGTYIYICIYIYIHFSYVGTWALGGDTVVSTMGCLQCIMGCFGSKWPVILA